MQTKEAGRHNGLGERLRTEIDKAAHLGLRPQQRADLISPMVDQVIQAAAAPHPGVHSYLNSFGEIGTSVLVVDRALELQNQPAGRDRTTGKAAY